MTDKELMIELERLAAAFPWQSVDLWLHRKPQGKYSFTAFVNDNAERALLQCSAEEDTPRKAVDAAIVENAKLDANLQRLDAIYASQEQLERLKSQAGETPPYRPNPEFAP